MSSISKNENLNKFSTYYNIKLKTKKFLLLYMITRGYAPRGRGEESNISKANFSWGVVPSPKIVINLARA